MTIRFFVDAVPVAQPRQRHRIVDAGGNAFVQNYTPKLHPVNAFKQLVQTRARQAYQGPLLLGPVRVSLLLLMPRPSRLIWKKRPMPRDWCAAKPDRDNAEKAILDSLKGVVFVDDAQVCDGVVQKMYHAGDEAPGVHVEIEEIV